MKLLTVGLVTGAFLSPASCILAVGAGLKAEARAEPSSNDGLFANAALRSLHDLARAAARYQQAAKDSDQLGCHDAYMGAQKAAHEGLTEMHSMSSTPIDAIEDVSRLLRLGQLVQNTCSDDVATQSLFLIAGQAIMALRYDYAIGDEDWYTTSKGGAINAKNPLRYSQSLRDQNYSWVDVRPKGMLFIVPSDWKAEMASRDAGDAAIENSGSNLKAVEVGYRQHPGDSNATVYFYRTKEDAQSAMDAANALTELDAKADADLKASKAEWSEKLGSLPYMMADQSTGFRLVYGVCRDTGKKDPDGSWVCADDDSHDWSDSPEAPYHWFSNFQSCEDAQQKLIGNTPPDVTVGSHDAFVSTCLPAPKMDRRLAKGYEMMFTIVAPGALEDDALYAKLTDRRSKSATVFTTFKSCNEAIDPARAMALKEFGADKDGKLLSDKTKSIGLWANCVRVY
jgi:hypothetical protein